MYLGYVPSPPKVLARDIRRHLVEPGLLEEKYVKVWETMYTLYKAASKKEVKELKGTEVDDWIAKTEDFANRIEKLLKKLEEERKATDIQKNYEVMVKASIAALKALGKLPEDPKKMPEAFKKELVDSGLISQTYGDILGKVVDMRKALEEKKTDKIPDRDVWMAKEYVRRFVGEVRHVIEDKGKTIREEEFKSSQSDVSKGAKIEISRGTKRKNKPNKS